MMLYKVDENYISDYSMRRRKWNRQHSWFHRHGSHGAQCRAGLVNFVYMTNGSDSRKVTTCFLATTLPFHAL